MKTKAICLIALALLAGLSLANVDTLHIELIDSLDAPSNYDFFHYGITTGWPIEYSYSGTGNWDLAMGDSFMVWLPGNTQMIFVDHENHAELDTTIDPHSGSENIVLCAIQDSIFFTGGSVFIYSIMWDDDSIIFKDEIFTGFADYNFAALEDSFLYTINLSHMDTTGLTCINIANPESIFIYRGVADGGSKLGLEVIDGYAYSGYSGSLRDSPYGRAWPIFHIFKTDVTNSDTPGPVSGGYYSENRCLGSICSDGEFIYFVNSEMSDGPAWTIGGSDLFVLGTDTSYSFDSRWDGQGVFSVEVIGENLLAVGFEYGVSVLNISNLDSIYESAFYIDTLGAMDITHFAIKEDRLYAMGHPRADFATLYMFKLDDCVISDIEDELPPQTALPEAFEISAYPNPFNSAVTIAIEGAGVCDTPLRVEIFDVNGRKIADAEPVEAGAGRLTKDTSTGSVSVFAPLHKGGQGGSYIWRPDESLPSGVYLVRARFDRLSDRDGRGDLDPTGTVATARVVYLK